MRFIVATQETNGDVAGDFTFCVEGELVTLDEAFERGQQIAQHFPVGSVIGRRLDQVFARLAASAP